MITSLITPEEKYILDPLAYISGTCSRACQMLMEVDTFFPSRIGVGRPVPTAPTPTLFLPPALCPPASIHYSLVEFTDGSSYELPVGPGRGPSLLKPSAFWSSGLQLLCKQEVEMDLTGALSPGGWRTALCLSGWCFCVQCH